MEAYPIELGYHVRDYYFGERLIPELLGKRDTPEGKVSETWEISDYRETTGTVANGSYRGRTLHELVEEFLHHSLDVLRLNACGRCPDGDRTGSERLDFKTIRT